MAEINDFLKHLRKKNKLTQIELAKKLETTNITVSKIENNTIPSDKMLKKYSILFNVDLSKLMTLKTKENIEKIRNDIKEENDANNNKFHQELISFENFIKDYDIVKIPYFESVSAGIEHSLVEDYPIEMMTMVLKKGTYSNLDALVAVKVNGESMNRIIPNHSIAVIDKKAMIKNNDIIGYQLGSDYGLKRFEDAGDSILLKPESFSDDFKDRIIPKEAVDDLEFMIIGKVIHIQTNDFSLENKNN